MKKMTVAQKLIHLRGDKTQAEVAKALNLAVSTVSMYERGERIPSDKVKVKIAKYFKTTVSDIFFTE